MNEDQLAEAVFAATDVFRVEALPAFCVDSDQDWLDLYVNGGDKPDAELKRPWLDRITAAAQRGSPWRRLRVIHDPVTDYERYQVEWSYFDNAAAGETIRVVDYADWIEGARSGMWVGETYFLDGRVIELRYDEDGRFLRAEETGDRERAQIADNLWAFARPLRDWWDARTDLHRSVSA